MSFKPKNSNTPRSNNSGESTGLFPVPKAGSRKARVSLIVDLGEQNRPDFEDEKTGETKPQKPCQQVAIFADLVNDTVDYGGTIGKQHYRLLLNKTFAGEITGVNFMFVPPKDAKGKIIEGKQWQLHPANLMTKLAKAVNKPDIIESGDIEQLLDCPFMAQVEVKEKDSGKQNDKGEPIIYRNVNYKGCSEVPLDDDDEPMQVAELNTSAKCITFQNAKVEDIKFIRKKLIDMIKLANDYAGSNMEKAIQAFEAQQNSDAPEEAEEEKPKPTKPAAKKPAKKEPEPTEDDGDDSEPW
jgi:hypothetical protein